MIYWQNSDGTFSVPYWLATFGDGSTKTIYDQRLVLDVLGETSEWEKIEMKISVRYRRPSAGTEVSPR